MSEKSTSRIEFISKIYQKALRNKQTNHGNQKEVKSSTLKTLVIALQVELFFWCTDLFYNEHRKLKMRLRHSNTSYSSHGGDLSIRHPEWGFGLAYG